MGRSKLSHTGMIGFGKTNTGLERETVIQIWERNFDKGCGASNLELCNVMF